MWDVGDHRAALAGRAGRRAKRITSCRESDISRETPADPSPHTGAKLQQLQFGGVGRIAGHYEWDDDDPAPSHKREGGLHQNLFDKNGKLKGNARFIPDDGSEAETLLTRSSRSSPRRT